MKRGPKPLSLYEEWLRMLEDSSRDGECILVRKHQRRAEGRAWYASQIADHIARGPIPDGVRLVRTCGKRNCINPSHIARTEHKGFR